MKGPLYDDVLAWARSALGEPPNAPRADVRAAALRLARRNDFAPAIDDAIAIGIALERPRDVVEAFSREVCYSRAENDLARDIDQFAHTFFDVAPEERRRAWTNLHARAATFPWWRARLDHLKRGLDVARPANLSGRLASAAVELFGLPASERAARRRQLAVEWRDAGPVTAQELAAFSRAYPALARIGGDFASGDLGDRKPGSKTDPLPAPAPARSRYSEPARTTVKSNGEHPVRPGIMVWGIVVVGLFVVRIVFSGAFGDNQPKPLPPPPRPLVADKPVNELVVRPPAPPRKLWRTPEGKLIAIDWDEEPPEGSKLAFPFRPRIKSDAPKAEALKIEPPKVDAPKVEAPKVADP